MLSSRYTAWKFGNGAISTNADCDNVHKMDHEFFQHPGSRFEIFMLNELANLTVLYFQPFSFYKRKNAKLADIFIFLFRWQANFTILKTSKQSNNISGVLNSWCCNSLKFKDNPLCVELHNNEFIKRGGILHAVKTLLNFLPDYSIVTWKYLQDIRQCLTFIFELPSGVRTDIIVWSFTDDDNAIKN